tara:strand:+ start:389 stop:1255 length:867 start_codon:yes stop_codon:yes gene_type:complete
MPSHQLNDTEIASQSIFLHSKDAELSISSSEKIFFLDQSIIAPSGYRLLIGLTNLTLPNSIFNVTKESRNIVVDNQEYRLTPDNYSAEDLATAIQDKLLAGDSDTGAPALPSGTKCEFLDQGKNFKFTFTTDIQIQSSTMERQLGLKDQFPAPIFASNREYTAKDICDLGGATNIYVRIRNLTFNNLDSRGKVSNVIASVVNNSNYGGYIFFVPPEVLYYQINENSISHLDIELTDQEGNVLDLNGAEFNLTLTIHYVKQRQSVAGNTLLKQIKEQYDKQNEIIEQKK